MPLTYEEFIAKSRVLHQELFLHENCKKMKYLNDEEVENYIKKCIASSYTTDRLVEAGFLPSTQTPYEMFCQNEQKYLHSISIGYISSDVYNEIDYDYDFVKTLPLKIKKCFIEVYFDQRHSRKLNGKGLTHESFKYLFQYLETFEDYIEFLNALGQMEIRGKDFNNHTMLKETVGDELFNEVTTNLEQIINIANAENEIEKQKHLAEQEKIKQKKEAKDKMYNENRELYYETYGMPIIELNAELKQLTKNVKDIGDKTHKLINEYNILVKAEMKQFIKKVRNGETPDIVEYDNKLLQMKNERKNNLNALNEELNVLKIHCEKFMKYQTKNTNDITNLIGEFSKITENLFFSIDTSEYEEKEQPIQPIE